MLTLQSASQGSMDANDVGIAAVVATLNSGWAGLFAFNTTVSGSQPKQLVELNHPLGFCRDVALSMHVLGNNDAGQIAVLASVQTSFGPDIQLWRVTKAPTTQTTYCARPVPFPGPRMPSVPVLR